MEKKSKYTFRVHFVKHQIFYTPVYLCASDYKIEFVTESYGESDAQLVEELFNDDESEANVIDLYITGGPDVVSYLRKKPDLDQRVYFWLPLVDRLPLPLVRHKDTRHGDYRLSELAANPEVSSILFPPQETTLHYFTSKLFDHEAFREKYMDDGLFPEDNQAIINDLEKHANLFKGKLRPQTDFDAIPRTLKEDPEQLAFYLSEDPDIHKFKKIHLPMDVVVFTCLYSRADVWNNISKRSALIEFCKAVSLNINRLHDFNSFYRKAEGNYQVNNELVRAMTAYYGEKRIEDISREKINGFVRTLKYLTQHRVFALNLQTDLQLKSQRFLEYEQLLADPTIKKSDIRQEKDIYYKFRLYYWMSRGIVVNVNAEIDNLHEQERAHTQFLESISASTHSLKTTINTLLGYALNTLKEMGEYDEECIDLLYEAKETLLINTELINVVSKLSAPNYTLQSRIKALVDAKLYDEKYEPIDLFEVMQQHLNMLGKDASLNPTTIELVNKEPIQLPRSFLRFGNLYPTRRFYKMVALTICENCRTYGKAIGGVIPLSIELDNRHLSFKNPTDHNYDQRISLTGNWNVIHSVLQQLKIGEVQLKKKQHEFTSVISNEFYGKN